MTQGPGLANEFHAAQLLTIVVNIRDHLDHVVHVGLGVHAARDSQAHQVHVGRFFRAVRVQAEHRGADLAAANAAGLVQFDCQ